MYRKPGLLVFNLFSQEALWDIFETFYSFPTSSFILVSVSFIFPNPMGGSRVGGIPKDLGQEAEYFLHTKNSYGKRKFIFPM